MQPDLHSRFASERLKDDHAGLQPEDDGTATLEPESITIRPLQERRRAGRGAARAAGRAPGSARAAPARRGRGLDRGRDRTSRAARRSRTRSRAAPVRCRSCTSGPRSCGRPRSGLQSHHEGCVAGSHGSGRRQVRRARADGRGLLQRVPHLRHDQHRQPCVRGRGWSRDRGVGRGQAARPSHLADGPPRPVPPHQTTRSAPISCARPRSPPGCRPAPWGD